MYRFLRIVVMCATTVAFAAFLAAGVRLLLWNSTSDPLEATILVQATRLAEDRPILSDPATESGTALMPGLPFAVSILVRLFDAHLWEPRLLSLLACLGAAALVWVLIRKETKSGTLGAVGATVLLVGQGLLGGAPSAASPEAVSFLLTLLGFAAIRYSRGVPGALLAALPLAAACFTHPDGLWFAFAALIHLAVHDRRRFFTCGPALVVLVGGTHGLLGATLGPWYNFEAWDGFLAGLRFAPLALLRFLGSQLLGTLGVFTLATVLAFTLPVRPWRGAVGLWTWMAFAALGAGVAATQSGVAAADALRPAAFALALVGPISIQRVTQHLSAWPGSSRMAGQRVMLTALLLQLITLFASMSLAPLGFPG